MNLLTEILFGKHSDFYKKIIEIEKASLDLRIKGGLSFVDRLPKNIVSKEAEINGIRFTQGDVIDRPIYNKFKKIHIRHYGVFYGVDDQDQVWVIHKQANGYIYVHTLSQYMKDLDYSEIEIIKKPEGTTIDDIVYRALQIENEPYTALDNNCQHFISWAVFKSYNSISVDQTKQKFLDKYNAWKEGREKRIN